MPELPEVETMRRGISGAVGCRVTDAHRYRSPQKPISTKPSWNSIARQLKGRRISRIGRHGKRLTIEFDTELTMVIEPRMTGLILIGKPPTYEHLRFEIKLSGGECDRIRYWDRRGLGKVYLLRRAQAEAYFDPRRIGPDALLLSADQLGETSAIEILPSK